MHRRRSASRFGASPSGRLGLGDRINGIIPNLTGVEFGAAGPSLLSRGFVTYGSDSGHQLPAFGRNIDPDPSDTSANACLADGQISTLEFVYSHYKFASPLANGVREFGMWLPNTDLSGSGLILPARFRGQEGATPDASMHSHLGVLGVRGFLMQDIKANPLDYVEGGALNERRRFLSEILDSTSPDFNAFARRGGKMIVAIGTNDTLASPGSQLDFFQSIINKMKRAEVDRFARLYVMPQTGHGLSGTNYGTSGDGKTLQVAPIPNTWDRLTLLFDWVERGVALGMSITVSAGEKSLPLCSYPTCPQYVSGPLASASSYRCSLSN